MDFEARIGERFDVHGVDAHWEPHADSEWVRRLARARREASGKTAEGPGSYDGGVPGAPEAIRRRPEVAAPRLGDPIAFANARIENISVSGAGVLAPAHPRCAVETLVTVTLAPGVSFEGIIRRVHPSDEVGWAYYGIEFTSLSRSFMAWLDDVIESRRATHSIG